MILASPLFVPDARIVWTHRDPADSIPSVCSLVSTLRIAGGETVDKPALGRMMLDFQAEGVRRAMAARTRIGAARFVDVTQADLSRDTFGTIETLYRQLDLPFDQTFRRHLESRLADRPRGRDGKHSYTLAEFGLTLDDIRNRFGNYERTFAVPLEVETGSWPAASAT